jgi:pyrimidine operon attenuation protein / uracil phosphoribosyltransferase
MPQKVLILTNDQIRQKIDRIAYQIYENNHDESAVIIAGIIDRGYLLASQIAEKLGSISDLKIELVKLIPDRNNLIEGDVKMEPSTDALNKVIVVVDDVLNTGNTLIHCLKHFLSFPVKKLSTAVLVDRNHKDFPVKVDYIGLKVSTTLQEHIQVEFKEGSTEAYLV